MEKELSEMTLEELWQLFPIFLVRHKPEWAVYYREMEKKLHGVLSAFSVVRISHIGSTAIKDIWAKDIVDVLVEVANSASLDMVAKALEQNDFIRMSSDDNRISLNMGYTKNGFADKVFHIHLRYAGDNDELYFRDYLNEHPHVAKQYEELKLELWKRHEHDRDAYTAEKSDFIRHWTSEARRLYGDKYSRFEWLDRNI
ncbi:MAG: GrpB family protein [Victivallales bacterium]|nr:GrpB family protein [Victivallales bacterium]